MCEMVGVSVCVVCWCVSVMYWSVLGGTCVACLFDLYVCGVVK